METPRNVTGHGRERGGLTLSLLLPVFSTPPSLRATSPIFCITKHSGGVWLYSLQTCRGLFCFTPPSPYGHSPYISSKTPRNATGHDRERGGLTLSLLLPVFSTPPSLRATSPIFCITKHRGGGLKCHAMP